VFGLNRPWQQHRGTISLESHSEWFFPQSEFTRYQRA